jgi:hypothetical protein
MALTYPQLVDVVQSTVENYEVTFVANIPTFAREAEQAIYNAVQIPSLRRNQTGHFSRDNEYLTMPDDFLAVYSMAVVQPSGAFAYLLNKDVSFIREAYANDSVTGVPKHYAIFDDEAFIVGPTPNDDYEVELHYYYYPPSIVDAGSSWLGENFEAVLLYGTLVKAYIFMKGEEDVLKMYQSQYADAMQQLERLGSGLNRRDEYRSGAKRVSI